MVIQKINEVKALDKYSIIFDYISLSDNKFAWFTNNKRSFQAHDNGERFLKSLILQGACFVLDARVYQTANRCSWKIVHKNHLFGN